jgi:NAD(P)-dependent dehydrogenase (short-subunit alcohol dehydrogenase family)
LYAEGEDVAAGSHPLRRLGVPDEVADTVAFLVSDKASWITLQTSILDGVTLTGGH